MNLGLGLGLSEQQRLSLRRLGTCGIRGSCRAATVRLGSSSRQKLSPHSSPVAMGLTRDRAFEALGSLPDDFRAGQLLSFVESMTEEQLSNIQAVKDASSSAKICGYLDEMQRPSVRSQADESLMALRQLKGQVLSLRMQMEMRKRSITDSAEVGQHTCEAFPPCHPDVLLDKLGREGVDMDAVVDLLQQHEGLFQAASDTTDANDVQSLFNSALESLLSSSICMQHQQRLFACDTSSSCYRTVPKIQKMAITVSTHRKPARGQVLWSTAVAIGELKSDLSKSKSYNEALGQLSDRMTTVFQQQPGRSWCFGFLGGGSQIEVVLFTRDLSRSLCIVHRTGLLDFSLSTTSPGLKWLAILLRASPVQLGFITQPTTSFTATINDHEWDVKYEELLQADLRKSGSTVQKCSCTNKATGEVTAAVLKSGPGTGAEADMIGYINEAGVRGVPTLLHKGILPSGQPYFLITPVGVHPDPANPALLLKAASDIAFTLEGLAQQQVMQLDISPLNISLDEADNGMLLDFGLAKAMPIFGRVSSGTRDYMSLARLEGQAPTLSGELESLLYVLISWASGGQLHWKHADGPMLAIALKHYAMQRAFKAKVLARCNPVLHPALVDLRALFFTPEYRTSVEASDFIRVCTKHMQTLEANV